MSDFESSASVNRPLLVVDLIDQNDNDTRSSGDSRTEIVQPTGLQEAGYQTLQGVVSLCVYSFLNSLTVNLPPGNQQAPEICTIYALPVSPDFVRHAIRQRFDQNRHVTDLRVIDQLLLKGHQEYQETMNCWKQYDHVMGILLEPVNKPRKTFLQKFYEGEFCSYFRGFICSCNVQFL